jgi:hypothetical protein
VYPGRFQPVKAGQPVSQDLDMLILQSAVQLCTVTGGQNGRLTDGGQCGQIPQRIGDMFATESDLFP